LCSLHPKNISHIFFKDKTLYKDWIGLKLEVTHFCIFGSHVWFMITSEKRKTLDPNNTECIFVGYPNGVKGYILIYISLDRLIIEHSVQFEESVSHVPQQLHSETFVLPPVRDDEHAHVESYSYEIYDS
jgi:hypothetical protein